MATGNIITGARARVLLNGVQLGFATGVSVREAITYEPVNVLDNIQTKEHVPTGYEVSWTADVIRIVGTTFKSQGWFPVQGKDAAAHLTNILNTGVLTMTIEDSKESQIIKNLEGVRVSELNTTFNARGIVARNVSGVAIVAREEADLT